MRSALTRQRLAETAAREALIRQLGLWGDAVRKLTLPSRLPALPESQLDYPSVEGEAIAGRLDVQIAKATIEAMASTPQPFPVLDRVRSGHGKRR
jgi:outer membrane protein TolC